MLKKGRRMQQMKMEKADRSHTLSRDSSGISNGFCCLLKPTVVDVASPAK
uniref:Uncharacterized protein n=1 Tax=Rhizophora mucronata TaxID=61149 RepID=A0A2P2MZE8_RHIMU